MSPSLFARAIFEGRPIDVFNHGKMQRDFTYIDDIVEGVIRILDKPAVSNPDYDALNPDPSSSNVPWRIFNIGNHQPAELMDYIGLIEKAVGKPAIINFKPMQDGDVLATYANTDLLNNWVGFSPATPLEVGLERFVEWIRGYHQYK